MESSIKLDKSIVWDIRDIALVATIILIISFIATGGILYVLGDTHVSSIVARYVIGLTVAITPLLWLKIKYKLTKQSVGLNSANLNFLWYLLIILIAIIYHIILASVSHSFDRMFVAKFSLHFFELAFITISIYSFSTIIISPIGEEIFWRGFIYKYLRCKLGPVLGLIIQAAMFSSLHLSPSNNIHSNIVAVANAVVIGLITGLLYEKTGSIYPSITFHCLTNYISVVIAALQK